MKSLKGKGALVIGGSSGVGKATVKALIAEGVRVTAVARGADKLQALKKAASSCSNEHKDKFSQPTNERR